MSHNAIALGCLFVGAALAVFLPQWLPGLNQQFFGAAFAKFLASSLGFVVGVYLVALLASLFAKKDSFSPSRVTLMSVLGALVGFAANVVVIPYLPPNFRHPASGDNPLFVTSTNLALSGFYLILPVVVAFVLVRVALAVHGKLSKLMRWVCVTCFAGILVTGYWFFGRSVSADPEISSSAGTAPPSQKPR